MGGKRKKEGLGGGMWEKEGGLREKEGGEGRRRKEVLGLVLGEKLCDKR